MSRKLADMAAITLEGALIVFAAELRANPLRISLVSGRRCANDFPETLGEMTLIGKTRLQRHLSNRQSLPQKLLAKFDPKLTLQSLHGDPDVPPKFAHEMVRTDLQRSRNIGYGKFLLIIRFYQGIGAANKDGGRPDRKRG
ncbi:hypothetical protein MCBRY_003643 [Methylocystis bryophila]